MSQSRTQSLVEAWANIGVGLVVSFIANATVFPLFGFSPTAGQNVAITLIYTAISLARSYTLRRLFNRFGAR